MLRTKLVRVNRELVAKAEVVDSDQRVVLDVGSTKLRLCGEQEPVRTNGHFESTCHHLLLRFNGGLCGWRCPIESRNSSLTNLRQRLVKTEVRMVKHARYYWLPLSEGYLNLRRFGAKQGGS
jgi:hypothetical protein